MFHPLSEFKTRDWWGRENDHHELEHFQPIIYHLAYNLPLIEWCQKNHPGVDPSKCYAAYAFTKKHHEYYSIRDFGLMYFGYNNPDFNRGFLIWQRKISYYVLYFGFFFYIMKINFSKRSMIAFSFLRNMVFSSTILFSKFRFGPDTTAYINQAA